MDNEISFTLPSYIPPWIPFSVFWIAILFPIYLILFTLLYFLLRLNRVISFKKLVGFVAISIGIHTAYWAALDNIHKSSILPLIIWNIVAVLLCIILGKYFLKLSGRQYILFTIIGSIFLSVWPSLLSN